MLAVLHVFAIGLQNARSGAGFGKNFAQHGEIEPERVAQAKTFRQASGIDVHHHVDQRFYLRRFASFPDVANSFAKLFQNWLGGAKRLLFAPAH